MVILTLSCIIVNFQYPISDLEQSSLAEQYNVHKNRQVEIKEEYEGGEQGKTVY